MVERRAYVDVNVFVYWLTAHPKFGATALKWIKSIEQASSQTYITSSLTIYEVLIIVAGLSGKNLKDKNFIENVVSSITGLRGLYIQPLTKEDAVSATNLMRKYGLCYEDSLHLASALRANAEIIISNDRDFDRTLISRVF